MSWQEVYEQADALRDLAEELTERYDYTADLLRDVFLAAYKADPPTARPRGDERLSGAQPPDRRGDDRPGVRGSAPRDRRRPLRRGDGRPVPGRCPAPNA